VIEDICLSKTSRRILNGFLKKHRVLSYKGVTVKGEYGISIHKDEVTITGMILGEVDKIMLHLLDEELNVILNRIFPRYDAFLDLRKSSGCIWLCPPPLDVTGDFYPAGVGVYPDKFSIEYMFVLNKIPYKWELDQ